MLQKKIFRYAILCCLVLVIGYTLHSTILNYFEITHPFKLWKIYLFQGITTLILCASFEIISQKSQKYRDQLGFLYLGAMVLKVILFSAFFSSILISSLVLSKLDSLSLLIPIFIFLFLEVVIIVKILNRNN
ncbi:DUF6168 family protein [Aequorivita lipolytica]|uniref:Uncharacterized protein n=1 Tax=Aequorivita lipolytica TaxID=153267 RepID=A0A5C6YSI5_9FLAO|nr:DUF6168 family protein [Aequorivita lipolytica]TXD70307.1 hypothetical protein ESV24_03845 [Aequorivita lipolytica]SRX50735.1 hypothetical protein AEQU2_01211 [Aequorivita lipolytica]